MIPCTDPAMDDGAGVAVLLQIAEAMAHRKVRNPVIFLERR